MSRFLNVGFDLDVNGANLEDLRKSLAEKHWGGIIVGWCTRGHVEFTELFESVVAICVEYIVDRKQGCYSAKEPKLVFCRGVEDVVHATVRNSIFPWGIRRAINIRTRCWSTLVGPLLLFPRCLERPIIYQWRSVILDMPSLLLYVRA